MAIPYEKIVAEDLNLGHGTTDVSMPAGGSATGRKIGLHTFNDSWFNVKDFGALGDGVSDDTAAMDAAKTAAAAVGGVLFFPEGTYCFDYTNSSPTYGFYVSSTGMTVCGAGVGLTTLKNMSASAAGIRCANSYVNVRNLTIDQNSSTGNAFQLGGQYSKADNLIIKNQGGSGYAFVFSGCTLSEVTNVHLFTCSNGFYSATTPVQYISFYHCSAEITSGTALSIASGSNIRLYGFYIEDGSAAGNITRLVSLDGCENVDFFSFGYEISTRVLTDDEFVKINNSKSVNFFGGRIYHNATGSKSLFKVTGTTSRNINWDGLEVVSTQASVVIFDVDASATIYGVSARNIQTTLTSAASGMKHTSAVILCNIENWFDHSAASSHTLNGASHTASNVEGAIACTYVSPGGYTFLNCTGTLSGTGAVRAFRWNSGPAPTAPATGVSKWMISNNASEIPVYADNAAALADGLVAGQIYRTSAGALLVTN